MHVDLKRLHRECCPLVLSVVKVFERFWEILSPIMRSLQELKPVMRREKTLKSQLESTKFKAITMDCWTALTTECYITVTCHYINEDWQSLSCRHTAENLTAKLVDAVETSGLDGKVSACVHDNACKIVAANYPGRVNWNSVPCFAHTLQLAINDEFNVFVHPQHTCMQGIGS